MGRMDDAAKRKVVELRMAGLSFRKIKAVLELEDIKVSAQTIYMFLRELQGRPPGRVRPAESGHPAPAVTVHNRASGSQESGSPTQNHARDALQHTALRTKTQTTEAGGTTPQQQIDSRERKDSEIKIVSVTSLANSMRRRVTPSPATSSVLAAGKKLLDRALSQRMKVTTLLRKDQSNQGSHLRSAVLQRARGYDVKSGLDPEGTSLSRKITFPRAAARCPNLPQVGVRLPSQSTAPLQTSGKSLIHLQNSGGQGRDEGNPSPQQMAQYSRGSLQDQIQSLGVEVRSLGLAVTMLREQQSRMEKEQAEQTNIQKQILKTLQLLASRAEPCTNQQQKRHTPPTSFSQDTFSFNPNSYPSCSQPSYDSIDNLESVEPFRLSPPSLNGFLPCSSSDSLPLTHTATFSGSYPQQSAQSLLPPYTQAFSPFAQSQVGTHRADFQNNPLSEGVSTQTAATSEPLGQDRQLSTIKVEGP
ncbi:uncharacterized protein LOC128750796 [Synchiropus splendidus]|uniref:uncharacterized protein LOC128750796 n=1 Tax=Synchiropus splendidus TaxID=270530 RepID=UPI00237DA800|nr:uncharacterized protein LOC128750796 [Synchiropus splendidus]XP_053707279.1 uncharacterized protein LOC128750796 [Synchiropus splendidus]